MAEKCSVCDKQKSSLACGLCNVKLCKDCAVFTEENQFSFYLKLDEKLKHSVFCSNCFDTEIQPEIDKYNELIEKAKEVVVFDNTQGKESRLLKRKEKAIKIENCEDREETLLRLAFQAVLIGCNAIVDVDLKSKKVKMGSYQTTLWSGYAMPTIVKNNKIYKNRSFWDNPN